jgi:hypothetical protein
MDYYKEPETINDSNNPVFRNPDIGGTGVPTNHPEFREQEEEIRKAQLERFFEAHPDFKQRVISDFEEQVSMLQSKIRDGKAVLLLMLKTINPNTHVLAKFEEHGPLLGILPASLYAVLTPLLIGIPRAVMYAPREILKVVENQRELNELLNIEEGNFLNTIKLVKQEIRELEDELVAYEV